MTTLELPVPLPKRHEWQDVGPAHGRFVVEPFEPGFALTVGNAFRRVLLSSIEGAAPTWAKIENVLHEFSYLPGMVEDTLDVLTNLRKVVFKLHGERSRLIRLRAAGPCVVKAGDFQTDADIEVLNPEQPLATLDRDGVLDVEHDGAGPLADRLRHPVAAVGRDEQEGADRPHGGAVRAQ